MPNTPTTPTAVPSAQSTVPSPTLPDLNDPDSILQWIVFGGLRHLATILGGALIAHGVTSSSDAQTVIGALIALGMMAWSAAEKYVKANAHAFALLAVAAHGKLQAQLGAVGAAVPAASTKNGAPPPPATTKAPGITGFILPRTIAALALGSVVLWFAVLYLNGCGTTAQQQAQFSDFVTMAKPIAAAAIEAAAASQGVSPTETAAVLTAADNLDGMAAQAWAGQPVSVGSALPSIASAVVPLLPATKTGTTAASILTAAALEARTQTSPQ